MKRESIMYYRNEIDKAVQAAEAEAGIGNFTAAVHRITDAINSVASLASAAAMEIDDAKPPF